MELLLLVALIGLIAGKSAGTSFAMPDATGVPVSSKTRVTVNAIAILAGIVISFINGPLGFAVLAFASGWSLKGTGSWLLTTISWFALIILSFMAYFAEGTGVLFNVRDLQKQANPQPIEVM